MKDWPLIAVTALYAWQCAALLWRGDAPHAVLVGGYVVANIGLIWSTAR